jgi:hypothetical protein
MIIQEMMKMKLVAKMMKEMMKMKLVAKMMKEMMIHQ